MAYPHPKIHFQLTGNITFSWSGLKAFTKHTGAWAMQELVKKGLRWPPQWSIKNYLFLGSTPPKYCFDKIYFLDPLPSFWYTLLMPLPSDPPLPWKLFQMKPWLHTPFPQASDKIFLSKIFLSTSEFAGERVNITNCSQVNNNDHFSKLLQCWSK